MMWVVFYLGFSLLTFVFAGGRLEQRKVRRIVVREHAGSSGSGDLGGCTGLAATISEKLDVILSPPLVADSDNLQSRLLRGNGR